MGQLAERVGERFEQYRNRISKLETTNADLTRKLAEAEKGLAEYADKHNWNGPKGGCQFAWIGDSENGYDIAQAALALIKGEKE